MSRKGVVPKIKDSESMGVKHTPETPFQKINVAKDVFVVNETIDDEMMTDVHAFNQ
jgi:hypothetical protein